MTKKKDIIKVGVGTTIVGALVLLQDYIHSQVIGSSSSIAAKTFLMGMWTIITLSLIIAITRLFSEDLSDDLETLEGVQERLEAEQQVHELRTVLNEHANGATQVTIQEKEKEEPVRVKEVPEDFIEVKKEE